MKIKTVTRALALACLGPLATDSAPAQGSARPPVGYGPALARRDLSGTTQMTFGRAHGTQLEYFDPGGRSFLLYPGNQVVLAGRWSVQAAGRGSSRVCFDYGATAFNPATGSRGGPECEDALAHKGAVVDVVRGDPFGLARRTRAPVVLGPERTTIADLLRRR